MTIAKMYESEPRFSHLKGENKDRPILHIQALGTAAAADINDVKRITVYCQIGIRRRQNVIEMFPVMSEQGGFADDSQSGRAIIVGDKDAQPAAFRNVHRVSRDDPGADRPYAWQARVEVMPDNHFAVGYSEGQQQAYLIYRIDEPHLISKNVDHPNRSVGALDVTLVAYSVRQAFGRDEDVPAKFEQMISVIKAKTMLDQHVLSYCELWGTFVPKSMQRIYEDAKIFTELLEAIPAEPQHFYAMLHQELTDYRKWMFENHSPRGFREIPVRISLGINDDGTIQLIGSVIKHKLITNDVAKPSGVDDDVQVLEEVPEAVSDAAKEARQAITVSDDHIEHVSFLTTLREKDGIPDDLVGHPLIGGAKTFIDLVSKLMKLQGATIIKLMAKV